MITDAITDAFMTAFIKSDGQLRPALEAVEPHIRNQAYEMAAARADQHMLDRDGATMGVGDVIRDMMTEVAA